jgi:hypothetical protein
MDSVRQQPDRLPCAALVAGNFPASWEKTGNFRLFRLARVVNGSRISEQPQCVTKEFPARWNREVLGLNRELNWEFRESFMVFNELSIWDVSWHFVLKQNKSAARDEITLTRHSQMGAIFAAANMVIVDFCAAQPDYPIDICAAWVY